MAKHVARYAITSGLSGCYMPDNGPHVIECATRAELADYIRHEIAFQDWPKACFAQVRIRNLWGFIRRNGSSAAHFSINHGAYEIAFHGLTDAEYMAALEQGDCC